MLKSVPYNFIIHTAEFVALFTVNQVCLIATPAKRLLDTHLHGVKMKLTSLHLCKIHPCGSPCWTVAVNWFSSSFLFSVQNLLKGFLQFCHCNLASVCARSFVYSCAMISIVFHWVNYDTKKEIKCCQLFIKFSCITLSGRSRYFLSISVLQ